MARQFPWRRGLGVEKTRIEREWDQREADRAVLERFGRRFDLQRGNAERIDGTRYQEYGRHPEEY